MKRSRLLLSRLPFVAGVADVYGQLIDQPDDQPEPTDQDQFADSPEHLRRILSSPTMRKVQPDSCHRSELRKVTRIELHENEGWSRDRATGRTVGTGHVSSRIRKRELQFALMRRVNPDASDGVSLASGSAR